jgi:hypothetical protein
VVGLHGDWDHETSILPLGNAYGDDLRIEWVRSKSPVTPGAVYAAAVVLAGSPTVIPSVSVRSDAYVIDWLDGSFDTIQLHPIPPRSGPTHRSDAPDRDSDE